MFKDKADRPLPCVYYYCLGVNKLPTEKSEHC